MLKANFNDSGFYSFNMFDNLLLSTGSCEYLNFPKNSFHARSKTRWRRSVYLPMV